MTKSTSKFELGGFDFLIYRRRQFLVGLAIRKRMDHGVEFEIGALIVGLRLKITW